jgi:hypothetical protein
MIKGKWGKSVDSGPRRSSVASLGDRLILAVGLCSVLGFFMGVLVVFSKRSGYGAITLLERVAIVATGLIAVVGIVGAFGKTYFLTSYVVLVIAYLIAHRSHRFDSPT